MRNTGPLLITLLVLAAACTEGTARESESAAPLTSGHIQRGGEAGPEPADSLPDVMGDRILSMELMIARFQDGVAAAEALDGGAARTRADLVARVAEAVADSSAAALRSLTLTAAEFGHLYFPTSIYARAPYEQPPEVTWLLMEQNSLKGLSRLLQRYGGTPLEVEGHDCAGELKVEGMNRIHEHCVVRIRGDDGRVEEVRLFGSIIERGGRFKLMSVSNRL